MVRKLTIDPKTELSVGFSYIDNRNYGFLYLEVKFPPREQYSKEKRAFIKEDEYTEARELAREKFKKFFQFEHVRTKQGKDVVAKWTNIYLKKFTALQEEVRKGLLADLTVMTEEDIDDDYRPDTKGIGHHSKQTY
jgi:hypothetical protein